MDRLGSAPPIFSDENNGSSEFGTCVATEIDGVRRAVRGSDMVDPEDWIVERPGTRQDPDLTSCRAYADEGEGDEERARRMRECVDALSAADQRGFCITGTMQSLPVPDPCMD